MISQIDFNKSMDSYLSGVKGKEEKEKIVSKPKEVKLSSDIDIYEEKVKESFWKKLFSKNTISSSDEVEFEDLEDETIEEAKVEYEELNKVEEKIEKRKESIFAKLFKKSYTKLNESDFDEDSVEVYDEHKDSEEISTLKHELKILGIISYDLMRKLSPEEIKRFKLSEDFNTYKEILKKHNLIRVKY